MSTADAFTVVSGQGGLPKVRLAAPDGAAAEVYLLGAHVTSWVPAGGKERLYLSGRSEFRIGAPIRGGVPVIFPQFARLGPLPQHGIVRTLPWKFAGGELAAGAAIARFSLQDGAETRQLWPHAFALELTVTLSGQQLQIALGAHNPGHASYDFTAALHTYLRVDDVAEAAVTDLSGVRYYDKAAGGVEAVQTGPAVRFSGEVDRIYYSPSSELRLTEPARTVVVREAGFTDAVVWNPAALKNASLADLDPGAYQHFVCVEAASVGEPPRLAPGERWQAAQTLVAQEAG